MPIVAVAKGNEHTPFARGLLSLGGVLPRFPGFEGEKAQEDEAKAEEED